MNEPTSGTSKNPNIVVIDDGFPPWMSLADKLAALGLKDIPHGLHEVALNPFDFPPVLDQLDDGSLPRATC
jgi:hypothetical protein